MSSHLETQRDPSPLTWLRCAPLLLLLLAVPASAQPSRGPDLGPVPAPLITFGEATPLDSETPAPGIKRRHAVVRVGAEVGGAVVTSLGLGVASALGGGLLGLVGCTQESDPCYSPILGALLGGALGFSIGVPLGVSWGGNKAGGNGSLAAAFGGLGVSVLSAGAAHLLGGENLGFVLLATAPVLSIVGYELTDSAPETPASTRVTPSVSVGSSGASFGLQGRF